MKFIEGLKLRKLGRDYIVVGESARLVNFNKMICLNESAAYLWSSVEGREFSAEDLKRLLLDEYEIDEATAAGDADKVLSAWKDAGLIVE